jgi:hypothetical protein
VLWSPLFIFSFNDTATTEIIGNCSLALAPVKAPERRKLAGMLSYVEAIPMDVLEAGVPWTWETFPEYMGAIGQRLGVNVGTLVGHSAIRLYAMGEQCSDRPATDAELEAMRRVLRESIDAGALGLSITRNMNHFDVEGKRIPAACAPESELFALADCPAREPAPRDPVRRGHESDEGRAAQPDLPGRAVGRSCTTRCSSRRGSRGGGRSTSSTSRRRRDRASGAIPLCNPGSVVNRFTDAGCQCSAACRPGCQS